MARMSIDDMFLRDPRVLVLAKLTGWSKYETRGRLLDVYAIVYDRVDDVLTAAEIDIAAEHTGLADQLMAAGLAEKVRNGVRIRGAEKRLDYLRSREVSGRAGGRKSGEVRKNKAKREPKVTFPTGEGPGNPPDPVPDPASVPDPDPVPDVSPEARTHIRERHPAAGPIARRVWSIANTFSVELKLANVLVPVWPHMHAPDHPGWQALLDRICELLVGSTAEQAERVALNRVQVAAAKAREDGDGQWFTPTAMFSKNSFAHWSSLDPASFARKPARGAREDGLSAVLRIAQEES